MSDRWLKFWILDKDKNVLEVEPTDPKFQEFWMDLPAKIVKQETIGDILISTVFTSHDASLGFGKPELFETMIFWLGNELNNWSDRYATWDEAVLGHMLVVQMVKKKIEGQ